MHADTIVALVSVGLATIIAISVPSVTFRLALRQDQARWLREQRAQLSVDLLTEAYAEQQWLTFTTADEGQRAGELPRIVARELVATAREVPQVLESVGDDEAACGLTGGATGRTAGLDVKIVQDVLGHSTSAITRDTYQHVRRQVRADAAEKVVALLPGDTIRTEAGQ